MSISITKNSYDGSFSVLFYLFLLSSFFKKSLTSNSLQHINVYFSFISSVTLLVLSSVLKVTLVSVCYFKIILLKSLLISESEELRFIFKFSSSVNLFKISYRVLFLI